VITRTRIRAAAIAVWIGAVWIGASSCDHHHDDFGDVGPGSSLVGGSCTDSGDCQDRCVRGGEWPGGMCTLSCRDDFDCPEGTACIEDEGGICALGCGSNPDCDMLGKGWACRSRNREGHSGVVSVCRGD
jgi:hypothetical protein